MRIHPSAIIHVLLIVLALSFACGAEPVTAPTSVTINAKDGAELVWVPAGSFAMGTSVEEVKAFIAARNDWSADWFADEQPKHQVELSGYWIYKYPVTVAQYRRFCQETKREIPELPEWITDDRPIVNVTWFDAADYAKWAGARLPTEAEWERAARGTDNRAYPWGNAWDVEKCNNYSDTNAKGGGFQGKQTSPVGAYPACASPYGVQDMAGNVWEWCADWYAPDAYAKSAAKDPKGPATGTLRVLRGGAWGSSSISVRTACRHADSPDATYHDDGGFRCVGGVPKTTAVGTPAAGVQP